MAEYGFPARHVPAPAAAAARSFARGDVDVLWRVQEDVIELARERFGCVELYRFAGDGSYGLAERSKRSLLRAAFADVLPAAGFGLLLATFIAAAVASSIGRDRLEEVLIATFAIGIVALVVIGFATPSSDKAVRRWIRRRYGTDEGWARVPRVAELGAATGNQQVKAAALADVARRSALARLREDGTLEVATRGRGVLTVHHVDRAGIVTHTEQQRKRSPLRSLVADDDWGKVLTDEPGD